MNSKANLDFDELTTAIYAALGEWTTHMQGLLDEETGLGSVTDEQLRQVMRAPLLAHVQSMLLPQRQKLRESLQYLLHHDAQIPYVEFSQHVPNVLIKKGSLSQKLRDSLQDAVTPYDGYALCKWLWEELFDDEDWRL